MSDTNLTLKQQVIKEIPPGFIRALYERVGYVYPTSHAKISNDPLLGEEQANYVLGHYRRGLAEKIFWDTGFEYGLAVECMQPDNGGCKHVRVSSENFKFSMCHVSTCGGFPKHSDSREQSSKINDHLQQQFMFPFESEVESANQPFYGIFVHTEITKKKDIFNSLHLGFPNTDFNGWVDEPIDIRDLIDIQQRLFQDRDDVYAEVQNDNPVWKYTKIDADEDKGKK